MTFDEYQKLAKRTDLGDATKGWNDPINFEKLLGLGGEAGELMDKFKKVLRDKGGVVSEIDRVKIVKEIGDVLWYLAVITDHLGVKFDEPARVNIAKLASRAERNLIHGAGDNR
ncbi:MAG: nucleoside triphosphate pyrophosphohydrolase family protein [Candidatus Nomurabacteria bacterium]|jgi:NTP pyrophosphatase (non-canonical NTP hydrolase)|nr:nucleoside triphosphate pyrophosphohydrolase family protein [Candidatus Nomurabacteria bacterium]